MKKKEKFGQLTVYELVAKNRSYMMGFAIMWVVLFHSHMNLHYSSLQWLQTLGYGGVDIFLFVSGFGITRSLERNSLSIYFKNRLKRIMPAWCLNFFVISLSLYLVGGGRPKISTIASALTFTGWWMGVSNQGSWYVFLIMALYFAAPVFYMLLKDSDKPVRTMLWLEVTLLLMSVGTFTGRWIMAVSRIPVFLIGMYTGMYYKERLLKKKDWAILSGVFLAGLAVLIIVIKQVSDDALYAYGLWWYPFILIAPSGCLLFSAISEWINFAVTLKPLAIVLCKLGEGSLEILLTHELIFEHFKATENRERLPLYIVSLITGVIVHELLGFLSKLLRKISA